MSYGYKTETRYTSTGGPQCVCDVQLTSTAFPGVAYMKCAVHTTEMDPNFFRVTNVLGIPMIVAPDDFMEFMGDTNPGISSIDIGDFMDAFYEWIED